MKNEAVAVVESEEERKMEGCREEGAFVELGLVSKDTQGVGFYWIDGGAGRQF